MTLQEINALKDKIYEIEGLLELAQMREDKIPELEPLISARINALLDKADVAVIPSGEDLENAVGQEIGQTAPEVEEMEEFEAEAYSRDKNEVSSEEDPAASPYHQPAGVLTELFEENDTVSVSRDVDALEIPEIEEPIVSDEVEIEMRKKETGSAAHSAKPAFTLNDRFRFRRELFSNSDAEYSAAMDLIASMDSYEEAEEYFLDELGWCLENQEVKDFMDIIQKYLA